MVKYTQSPEIPNQFKNNEINWTTIKKVKKIKKKQKKKNVLNKEIECCQKTKQNKKQWNDLSIQKSIVKVFRESRATLGQANENRDI